jgi:hypothetical protein
VTLDDDEDKGILSALNSLVFPKICIYCQNEFASLVQIVSSSGLLQCRGDMSEALQLTQRLPITQQAPE